MVRFNLPCWRPAQTSNLESEATGGVRYVTQLNVDDNVYVHKGDLMVQIDRRDYAAQIDEARAQLGLAQAQLLSAQAQLDIARVQFPAQYEEARADAERTQTEALLRQYDQQIAQSLNALAVLVGEAPGALDAELTPPAALPGTPPTVPVGLPATLARRRHDIRRAEASLHAATANVGVAVAQFYPDISLTGQIGTRATSPHDLAHWASLFWSWGPSVSLPVFQGGALVSNLRLSKLQQVEAALDYRSTVLGAQRQSSSAEQSAQQAQLQVCTDLVALYKALGGGWEQAGPIASSASSPVP
uniref:TolC family protein n=1 Tax=Paraburkholderia heleia TaxID=634127 RepID=UPI002AB6B301|nr:TolC family protein [Paraburkholderia heleia]